MNPRFTGTPPLRVWRTEEFGASAINWRIVVHPKTGFVYVANSAGVLEFDGVRWRLIRMPAAVSARIVLIAADDRVWAGGSGRVAVLEPGDAAAGESTGNLIARDVAPRIPPSVLAAASDLPATPAAGGEEPDAPVSGLATLVGVMPILLATPDGVVLRLRGDLVRFGGGGRVDSWQAPESINRLWWSDGAVHLTARVGGIHRIEAGRVQPVPITGQPRLLDTAQQPDGSWLWLTTTGPQIVRGTDIRPLGSAATRELLAGDVASNAIVLPDGGSGRHAAAIQRRLRRRRRLGRPRRNRHALATVSGGSIRRSRHRCAHRRGDRPPAFEFWCRVCRRRPALPPRRHHHATGHPSRRHHCRRCALLAHPTRHARRSHRRLDQSPRAGRRRAQLLLQPARRKSLRLATRPRRRHVGHPVAALGFHLRLQNRNLHRLRRDHQAHAHDLLDRAQLHRPRRQHPHRQHRNRQPGLQRHRARHGRRGIQDRRPRSQSEPQLRPAAGEAHALVRENRQRRYAPTTSRAAFLSSISAR